MHDIHDDHQNKSIFNRSINAIKHMSPITISIIYLLCTLIWIEVQDYVVEHNPMDKTMMYVWLFRFIYMIIISIIIYFLVRKSNKLLHTKKVAVDAVNRELDSSLTLLSGILESSPEIIMFALDNNYCYTAFNQLHKTTMKNIWGVEIHAGRSMLDYIGSSDDREKAKINFYKALNGESFNLDEEYGDVKYARKHYKNYYAPIFSKNGDVVGLTCYVIDISKEKNLEEYNEYLIYHDELTGLLNRRYYKHALEKLNHDDFLPTTLLCVT